MAVAQIVKWGNSLAVRIPKPLAGKARLNEGDRIVIKAANGRIELSRSEPLPTLKELVSRITPENRYGETSAGRERGKEVVEW
jgi:antitoxin MazE